MRIIEEVGLLTCFLKRWKGPFQNPQRVFRYSRIRSVSFGNFLNGTVLDNDFLLSNDKRIMTMLQAKRCKSIDPLPFDYCIWKNIGSTTNMVKKI